MVILVMGVSGVGKTTVCHSLAEALQWQFADADDYHSAANIAKMRSGIPLTDEDRAPWLQILHDKISAWLAGHENVVLACSALKESYRRVLVVGDDVRLVYLRGSFELVAARLGSREGHYMDPHLLRSQFATLEEPQNALTVDAGLTTTEIINKIRAAFGL